MPLETQRLLLVPCSLEFVEALPDREAAEELIGAAIPDGWPDDDLAGLLPLYADWVRHEASGVGFGPWVVVDREERTVAGSAGFQGHANEDGEIELGFGIVPRFRKRGFATEAAGALVRWGLDQPGVRAVVAECDPDNVASMRVLEKIGMKRRESDGPRLRWAVEKS